MGRDDLCFQEQHMSVNERNPNIEDEEYFKINSELNWVELEGEDDAERPIFTRNARALSRVCYLCGASKIGTTTPKR
ncbi:hypothetical protein N7490_000131 [Penicillium lividum]|nr:hypothetical protein N7490_000131 [Penicillium lividum]